MLTGSEAELKTRLTSMDATERKRNYGVTLDDNPATRETRCRAEELRLAFAVENEIAPEHAQRRYPEIAAHWDSSHASVVGGVDAAISARVKDECSKVLGQELHEEAWGQSSVVKSHGGLARADKERELAAWGRIKVFQPIDEDNPLGANLENSGGAGRT